MKKQVSKGNYTRASSSIVDDLNDSIGNKIASLHYISERLNFLNDNEGENFVKEEWAIFLDYLEKYTGLLVSEFQIFKWANEENNDFVINTIYKFSDIANDLSRRLGVKITVENNLKEDYILPVYWNRQIIFICIDVLTLILEGKDCSLIAIYFQHIGSTLQVKFAYDAKDFRDHNKTKDYRAIGRLNSINGKIYFSSKHSKNKKVLLNITLP